MISDRNSSSELIRYTLLEDGKSFGIDLSKAPKRINRTLHTSITHEVDAIEEFNRGVKRGDTILVSGDRPRFAIMRTFPEDKCDPDLIKLGDCRIGINCGGRFEWIDKFQQIETIFRPSYTEYSIKVPNFPGLLINLIVSQAEDWGALAKLTFKNTDNCLLNIDVKIFYGGLYRHGRTFTASYLDLGIEDLVRNIIEIKDRFTFLSNPDIQEKVCVWSLPNVKPEITENRVAFNYNIKLADAETKDIFLMVGRIDKTDKADKEDKEDRADKEDKTEKTENSEKIDLIEKKYQNLVEPEKLIQEACEYYENLLAGITISTPSKVLDSGFLTGIINLDYDYTGKLWLEGVHWWSSFWPINYQISAAISLGQLQRAKRALDFLGSLESGPCPVLMASEKPYLNHIGVYNLGIEEGLPYYLYQLIQYFRTTGDRELIQKLWDKITVSIETLFINRDTSGSGLLDWHFGCNGFLYQADHLAMPGDAASPSIMVLDVLGKLAEIASEIGKEEDSEKWKRTSKDMKKKLLDFMWNKSEGVFYNHIDYQNIKHRALYYTDMVFPALYSNFPEEIKQKSLENLCDRLIYETKDERLLMRVGELKPSIFGNDTVMPVQISEAARGFFETGRNEIGVKLLESVALASTVYTEAPGNFPERMDDDGKGEANYIFGNSIGSYIYSVVSGLFGISLKDDGKLLKCSPAFPTEWDHAKINLPYCSISYKKNLEGSNVRAIYKIISTPARKLEFSVLLDCGNEYDIICKNSVGEKKIKAEFGKTKVLFVSAGTADNFEIEIKYMPAGRIKEKSFKKLSNIPPQPKSTELETFEIIKFLPVDLNRYYNSDKIRAISAWRSEDLFISLTEYKKTSEIIEVKGIKFSVAEALDSNFVRMVLLEHSTSHPYTGKTIMSSYPQSLKIHLDKNIKALALLYASECQSRQTGIDVGEISLNYNNSIAEKVILNVGKNLDSLFSHFAKDTFPIEIPTPMQYYSGHPGTDYINLLVVPCDFTKVLNSIEFIVNLPDVQMGLIGISYI